MTGNLNDNVVVYPSEAGWIEIKKILTEKYREFKQFNVDEYIQFRRTLDDGYKDQLWSIMADIHGIFYNGSKFLKTTTFKVLG